MPLSRPALAGFLFAVIATVVAGIVYVGVQQHLRSAANHPQVEIARSAASQLNAGGSPQSVVPSALVDIGSTSDIYLIVVSASGGVVATSAKLDGADVIPPSGVFDYVRDHGEDIITWQPAVGARSAIVVDAFKGGYVVAGRSLKSTEDMESAWGWWALTGWALALVAGAGVSLLRARLAS